MINIPVMLSDIIPGFLFWNCTHNHAPIKDCLCLVVRVDRRDRFFDIKPFSLDYSLTRISLDTSLYGIRTCDKKEIIPYFQKIIEDIKALKRVTVNNDIYGDLDELLIYYSQEPAKIFKDLISLYKEVDMVT